MRPTDFCHPCVNCVHPHLVRSRITPPLSERGRPADFGIRAACPGDQAFHIAQIRFGGSSSDTFGASRSFRCRRGIASVGVFFPRCRFDRASDIPVASSSFSSVLTPLRVRSVFTRSAPAVSAKELVARGPDEEEAAKTAVTIEP
jgi:hypothetical protein